MESKATKKRMQGKIVSLVSGLNTVKVEVETVKPHKKYRKPIKSHKKYLVDIKEELKKDLEIGDEVIIYMVKPISASKNWRFLNKK